MAPNPGCAVNWGDSHYRLVNGQGTRPRNWTRIVTANPPPAPPRRRAVGRMPLSGPLLGGVKGWVGGSVHGKDCRDLASAQDSISFDPCRFRCQPTSKPRSNSRVTTSSKMVATPASFPSYRVSSPSAKRFAIARTSYAQPWKTGFLLGCVWDIDCPCSPELISTK